MAGHCKVIWTKEALENATAIVDYLIDNWSQRSFFSTIERKGKPSFASTQGFSFSGKEKRLSAKYVNGTDSNLL